MRLWPKTTSRKIALCVGVAVGAYICSYIVLSALGSYGFSQSGELRYTFGFATSDIIVWTPRYCWYQRNYRFVSGECGSRGNRLGHFYSPLILLDRAFFHITRPVFDNEPNSLPHRKMSNPRTERAAPARGH